MEFVSIVVNKALNPLVQPVGRQLGYLYSYGDNVVELKGRFQRLQGKMESLSHQVEAAKRNARVIEVSVTDWLEKAQSKLAEVDKFLKDERHQKTGCSQGVPNLKLRHQLGRKAKKMTSECDQLLQQEPNSNAISYQPHPEATETALYDSGYVPFKSREDVMEKVTNALRDPTAKMIGIYGQGGAGKSALVKEAARKAIQNKLFSVVVIANITSTPDVRKIQGEMAEMLGLRLEDEIPSGRAVRLRQRLKNERNALVILDDLWPGFDLNMLGILFRDHEISQMTVKDTVNDSQNQLETEKSPGDSKGCKILVTSRSKEVMSSEMGIQESLIFSLMDIEKEEAVELFKKVAKVTEKDVELEPLSAEIADRCSELPMAIIAVANALRNTKSKLAWETALEQMKRQEAVEVLKPVEFSTKLSYDHMQSEELKSFFLLCARISKDPSIADLVKYCIGLGIFQGVYTVKEARDRTNILVDKLKASSLLNASSTDQVTMHDLVRDAALSIAFKEQDIFTMRYGKLDEWPDKEKFERYTTISLHHCDISDGILESLNCPGLKVFHVESNNPSLIIPDKLFEGMGELTVLILVGIDLSSLPSSIRSLKKLRMLCLEQCVIGGNISIIGELKKLRVLSLSGSKFENLQSELRQLGKLQLFDISNCTELRVIPPNVISNLISLEELYMENDLIQWGVEGQTNQNKIACLYELWHLQQLKRLNIHVQDVATLPRSLSYDKLDGYRIVVGHFEPVLFEDFKMHCLFGASRELALQLKKGNANIDFHMGFIKMLLKSVNHLFLGELDGIQNVIHELNLEGFLYLKHLTIIKNPDIQYIINSKELGKDIMAFPKLESMCLYELQNMEKICNVTLLTMTSFFNLRTIKINICSQLKNLFPFFMVRHLTNLEIIEVSACEALEEIVFGERQDIGNAVEFPQLRTLTLQSLPTLTSFYTNEKMPPGFHNDEISVADEQSSTSVAILFNINVSVQNLTQLNVKDCDNLEYLFSLPMVWRLGNLQSLSVERCAMMKRIFKPEDNITDEAMNVIDVFPQLRKMEVTFMKELETVWYDQASLKSFCSLDYVIVKDCNKLVTIFPNYMVGRFSSLGRLEVMNCKLVEKIFDLEGSKEIGDKKETKLWNLRIEMMPKLKHIWSMDPKIILDFENLQIVQVMGCPDIENVFPISVASGRPKLEYIRVSTCPKLKEIVSNEGRSHENDIKFEFHQLTTIAFQQLPQLTSFYPEGHSVEFSALKQLYLIRCDKLETEKSVLCAVKQVISKLEAMGIGQQGMQWLQNCIGNDVNRLLNIKTLYLDGLRSMEMLFWFLQRTPNLENMFLVRCFNKEILSGGSLVAHEKIGTAVHLRSLRLRHLTYLEVSRCSRLENLMTSSTAKSLVQLIGMKITQCEMMTEIVIKEEKEGFDEIVFSKLKSLQLMYLRNLKSFCSCKEGLAFKFPSIEKLILRDCFKMEYFCKNITCIPKLRKVYVVEEEGEVWPKQTQEEEGKKWYWENDLNTTVKKIFEDMVFFQYTEDLRLFQHPKLDKVCQGQVPMPNNCFRNIKYLVVMECVMSSASFSKFLSYLKNLEKLEIGDGYMDVIFDIDELTEMNAYSFRLKTLTLDGLPFLKCLWSKDPHGFVSFPNLQEVVVSHCEKLETLLPASMAKNLVKLEISKCYALVEIVGKAEAVASKQSSTFQLPSLTSLRLDDLPELQCFYPEISILECPKLGVLRVIKCTKLDVFTSEVSSHQGAHGHEDEVGTSTHKQPLFLIEKVIPSLETLWLNKKMTSMLCCSQHHACMLHKLKELKLFFGDDDEDAATSLPFEFLQKLPNLTSLSIDHFNSLKEMLPSHKTKEINSNSIMFQNHEDLRVKSCPCLMTLVPSLASFCNLKQLIITECHGLVFLLPSSTAKSLVQLEKMNIRNCKSLEQIVSPDTGELGSDMVIFEKLTDINLISLPSLVTFSSGNAAILFPILQFGSIFDCPMMKIFSQGVIEAPNLIAIQASRDPRDLHYSEDLNSTVEKL
ncbi:hypothetical protein K1719_038095 [Acacia pycnantha]|nr:hypothetical protein K1719_038095 [Acacia pycnantha]